MYTTSNFKTKKALKEAVIKGDKVTYFQPGPFGGHEEKNGRILIEGPHFPEPHRWYAQCEARDGFIIKVT